MSKNKKLARIEAIKNDLLSRLESCDICPRDCKINRFKTPAGYCKAGKDINVYTAFKHFGEEPGISHSGGSGTIFFSGCNLRCAYCQNHHFSHNLSGKDLTPNDLARVMINLQNSGADNINLVTPTHYIPQIINALHEAVTRGLNIPIVYNSSGYEKPEVIAMLDGIVDIYLNDIRYFQNDISNELSNAPDYPLFAMPAAIQMYKQKKTIQHSPDGTICSGLIIRHLVLPNKVENSNQILRWISKNLPETMVSVMFQYKPYHIARNIPAINRCVSEDEYNSVLKTIEELDIKGWVQELNEQDDLAGVYFKPEIEKLL